MNVEDINNEQSRQIEARLWDYIDGISNTTEKEAIDKLIKENLEWKAKYNELIEIHSLINSTELEEPSLRFTKNVMEGIAKYQIAPATKNYINNKIIFGIAAFFITVIVAFVIYGIAQIDWTVENSKGISGINLSEVDYSQVFNNTFVNIFMMANVVLGLMLFDRYLNNKRKTLHKEAH